MPEITNITGLEKPLEKFIETVSEGVGVLGNHIFQFDVAKIKRIGAAEAEVEKQRIVAQAEAKEREKEIEVLSRAKVRFALEQYNKQINIENVLAKAKENLEGETVSDKPVEKDWTRRLLNIAQDVSREELQSVLSKILAGEIQRPGSFSYQTLEVVRFLSQTDLLKLQKFIALSSQVGFVQLKDGGKNGLEKYNLSFADYLGLASIGIFNQSSTLAYERDVPHNEKIKFSIGKNKFIILNDKKGLTMKLSFPIYLFSSVGMELRSLLVEGADNQKVEDYEIDFINEVQKQGFSIKRLDKE
jgi:hypothetical protein